MEEQTELRQKPETRKKELLGWLRDIAIAGLIVFVLFRFVLQAVTVNGMSMSPTLADGDRLLTFTLFYVPKQGDIVTLSENTGLDDSLIKRVAAVAGQTVDINENGEILVDGKVLSEPYIAETIDAFHCGSQEYPLTVPEGTVFVLGDNRNHSTDSRVLGPIGTGEVLGRVLFRLRPLNRMGPV